jgi:hypothetical protein
MATPNGASAIWAYGQQHRIEDALVTKSRVDGVHLGGNDNVLRDTRVFGTPPSGRAVVGFTWLFAPGSQGTPSATKLI